MDLLRNSQVPQKSSREEVPEVKKHLWSIDKGINDGQIKAGEVDKEQEEFLRNTKFVK
jgi:hypothetical protein